ncbi:ThuA domain-containing protein [uncultured Paludibaculum sp.]|uniref:ThuA domain-containing protein n=1 Tax=uncultured Paludibaculum sp. TaxID=1765020 RepID=UPI002AABEC40|nr:ThuA domain-containing protein [uncultured Paludibaculum sp.]
MLRSVLFLLCLSAVAQIRQVPDKFFFEEGKVRVLILTGRNNHDWRTTTPYLRRVLEVTGRFDVRVTEEPSGLTAETLRPYDVLVSNYCGPRWGPQAEKAVEEFVKSGKGLVVVHAGSYPFGDTAVLSEKMGRTDIYQLPWAAWGNMVGAVWSDKAPKTGHAQRHAYEVKWQDTQHPIAAGLRPAFLLSDELYHNFRLHPGVHILATAFDAPKIGGNGKDEPLLWTNACGAGRVFHTALGHDLDAMQSPGFTVSYARGVEWAATKAVTLPAQIDLHPKSKDALRVLLVSGGHDHETSLYGAFEGWPDVKVNVDPHPVAFRGDLRKRYDVIVLYDMLQDLPEAQRKNLQDYVESGKGLIVLHHAVVSFQNWPWWWKEVLGGHYFEKATDDHAASTYLHDVEMVATPVGTHPITKGLPQMRVFDETYKNLWHAPGIQPLLVTDEKTSDKELAWISPYEKSRVAVILLGHGREAHESPWFRSLLHKAILWSGSR